MYKMSQNFQKLAFFNEHVHNSFTNIMCRYYWQLLLIIITIVNKKMLHVSKPFIANLFKTVYNFLSAERLIPRTMIFPIFPWQQVLSSNISTSFEAKFCQCYILIDLNLFWVYFISGLIFIVDFTFLSEY